MANDVESALATSALEVQVYRPLLFGIVYRMVGSVAESEDIVQESFLRLHRARLSGVNVESPKAYLSALATRLAIDHLRSARARRESYVGPWLPEPIVQEEEPRLDRDTELAESVSMAFILILEALSPIERAVFLLRETFDYSYEEIAAVVEKSEENCRQIFARAKKHIDAGKRRFETSPAKRQKLAERFFAACQSGEIERLVEVLAADATFTSDGGGKTIVAGRPLFGRDRIARFLVRVFRSVRAGAVQLRRLDVNGQPGAMTIDADGRVITVLALETADGVIQSVRVVANPDKLRHLGPVSDLLARRGARHMKPSAGPTAFGTAEPSPDRDKLVD